MKDKEKQIFDRYGNYDFPTDIKQEGLNSATTQIEEMAKDFKSYLSSAWYNDKYVNSEVYSMVKHAYEDNYRKIPKDSVVLKIKELEDTCNKCHWVTGYKILKDHEEEVIKLCEQEVKQARKETASEILNDIHRYDGSLFGTCFHKGHYVSDVRDLVKDIAEEYGVEIKE